MTSSLHVTQPGNTTIHWILGPWPGITDHDLLIPVLDAVLALDPDDPGPFDSGLRMSNVTTFKDPKPRYEFDITVTGFHPIEFYINFIEVR
jgi:hypothetical protein